MEALGIRVDDALVGHWCDWLMPDVQPYLLPEAMAGELQLADGRDRVTPELRDSFALYGLRSTDAVCWLIRFEARRLPRDVRQAQPATHHWPRHDGIDPARVVRLVENSRRPSRHLEVGPRVWQRVARMLPGAHELSGMFPAKSGPNCFGAVMGAAGVDGAAGTWMQQEAFEEWLTSATSAGGSDDAIGTVLVWRGPDLALQHAAVTLGDGWALHKPSQGWMSPTMVLAVDEVKAGSRGAGRHLHRYSLG